KPWWRNSRSGKPHQQRSFRQNASIGGEKNKYESRLGVTPTATFTGRPVVAAMRAIKSPLDPDRATNLEQDFQSPMSCFGAMMRALVRSALGQEPKGSARARAVRCPPK